MSVLRISAEELFRLGGQQAERYRAAQPFPHGWYDDLFCDAELAAVEEAFPPPDDARWRRREHGNSLKLESRDEHLLPENVRRALAELASSPFVEFLERLTGIQGLIPDPHLQGAGLHQIGPGGFLKIHADFNRHERLALYRRLNVLVYLNRDWDPGYGGGLELWDEEMTECCQRIEPVFNRTAIFTTTDTSYHGHPDPLSCPADRCRRSLSMYYYTASDPGGGATAHSTLYRARPNEELESPSAVTALLRDLIPPLLARRLRRPRNRNSSLR